jgi:hypothetical protein
MNMKQRGGDDLSAEDIIQNYYLCTQSRYDKPIDDMLRPFGSLEEVSEIYKFYKDELSKIEEFKKESDKISDVKIVGTSQFGLYFRFVEKKLLDTYTMHDTNSIDFSETRSFIFDIDKLLEYINKDQVNGLIPLCWFAGFNAYGYQRYWNTVLFNHKNMILFLNGVGKLLLKNINDHEFVCRIPIPLKKEAGFIGKINSTILNINTKNADYNDNDYDHNHYYYHSSGNGNDNNHSDDYYLRYSDNYCNKNKSISDCLHKGKLKYCEWDSRTNKCFMRKKPWA